MHSKSHSDLRQVIKYQTAHAGGGKSRTIFEVVLNSNQPTIIATPTNALSLQYKNYFEDEGASPVVICRKLNEDYSSRQHLIDAVKARKKLIIVTQTILHECDSDLSDYRIFEDEIFNPLEIIKFERAKHIRPLFADLLAVEISVSPSYYRLALTPAAIEIAIGGWQQAVIKDSNDMLSLCGAVYNPDQDVYVLADAYNRYLSGAQNDIQFWTVLKPSVHEGRDVSIVGALFENSMTNLLWQDAAKFVPANLPIKDKGLTHNAHLADIRFISEKPLSGTLMKKVGHTSVFQKTAAAIFAEYPGRHYIFATNKMPNGKEYPWASDGDLATRVQVFAHGQNAYSGYDMAVYLATQFYDPATYKFLSEVFGLTARDVWKAITFDRLYQFALRICARNRHNKEPFTIIVPDRDCAMELSQIFGCTIEPRLIDLAIEEFRDDQPTKVALSATERKQKSREKLNDMKNDHHNTAQYAQYHMLFWSNKYAKEMLVQPMSWFDLAAILEQQNKEYKPANKSVAVCFREGDIADDRNHKLAGNIRSTKLVILDMDIVRRDPQDLSDYLTANGWSHLIFNSFSSTPLEPRIRVVIGLDEAVNPKNYLKIVNLLKADIDAKFGIGVFETDGSKITINAKFHAPSVSGFKAGLFIKRNITVAGQFMPRFLDVRWFLSRNAARQNKPDVSTTTARLAPIKEAVDDIIERFSVSSGQGKGSYNFHQAAVEMKKSGVSRDDCIAILTQNRHRFGHGADRDAVCTVGRVYASH